MKILVVDDNDTKKEAIASEVKASFVERDSVEIDFAENLSAAVVFAANNVYDLIVLDLMLPYVSGGKPSQNVGLELLRIIRDRDHRNNATQIIGLSEYPDEIHLSQLEFGGYGVLTVQYDESRNWINTLRHSVRNVLAKIARKITLDFIIVVALLEERSALERAGLSFVGDKIIDGLNVKVAEIKNVGQRKRGLVVLLHNMGLVNATLACASLLNKYAPTVLCMTGVCAGFKARVGFGQLVIASPAWEYQAGKWSEDGFLLAPFQVPLRAQTRAKLEKLCQESTIIELIEMGLPRETRRPSSIAQPALVPFASGSAVIAQESKLMEVEVQHRQVGGLDMEVYGLYAAAHQLAEHTCHYFAVKSVVDFADANKDDKIHEYGSFVSAKFALEFIQMI